MAESINGKGFVVPSIPKFDGHYDHWARLIENFIRSKEYWDLIEYGIPDDGGSAPTEAQRMEKNDQISKDLKLKNYLYQAIDREILDTILNTYTCKQIWDSMKQKYAGSTKVKRAQLQALRRDFEVLSMKEGEYVNSYFARTLAVAKKMKSCGEKVQETTITEKILRSLTKDFNYVVCNIEESNNLDMLSLDELQSNLLVHEQRMGTHVEEEQALKVATEERPIRGRGRGNFRGSFRGGRGRGRYNGRPPIKCYKCHKLGHIQFDCPMWEKEANYAESDEYEELLLMAYAEKDGTETDKVWFLDLGCSNHMTGNKQWFTTFDDKFSYSVKLGNNARLQVKGKGTIKLKVEGRTHMISDVYYIPELSANLLSMGQLQEKKLAILIDDGCCKIFHKEHGLILQSYMTTNKMFVLLAEVVSSSCLQATVDDVTNLWHQRYGHLSYNNLQLLSANQMVEGLPRMKGGSKICEVCNQGKQHREAIPKHVMWRTTQRLQLVHMDLCGPITPATTTNRRYILSFIDDFSRKTWVYFLAGKNEVFESFKNFKSLVEKEVGMSIRCLRSDR